MASDRVLEDYEFEEYVRSYRNSSDRGRWLLFAIVISCFVELVANWNIRDRSWPLAHLDRWKTLEQLKQLKQVPKTDELPVTATTIFGRPAASAWPLPSIEKKAALDAVPPEVQSDLPFAQRHEEYMKQFVARMAIVTIPIVGVSIDVNDLGTVFGIWLAFLMIVFALAISREYENLCLAFYKVGKLHESEERPDDGQSKANLLYHALAMSQVLSSPPTLARWKSWGRTLLGWLVVGLFYVPVALQTSIVITTYLQVRENPPSTSAEIGWKLQGTLIIVLLAAALAAARYSAAMGVRWVRMFYLINPSHQNLPDNSRKWMQVDERKERRLQVLRQLYRGISRGSQKIRHR